MRHPIGLALPLLSLLLTSACGSSGGGFRPQPDLTGLPPGDAAGSSDMAVAPGDMALPPGDMANTQRDMAVAQPDLLPPPPDLSAPIPDLTMPPDMAIRPGCVPRINEVLTGVSVVDGGALWEFVELYNPCAQAVDISDWKVGYRAAGNVMPVNVADQLLYTFPAQTSLGGFGYLLLTGPNYPGQSDGKLGSGLAASGSVGLRDPNLMLMESVAWGAVMVGNAFIETNPAPGPGTFAPPGQSISRIPNGTDTNDNSKDFIVTVPSPRAANM